MRSAPSPSALDAAGFVAEIGDNGYLEYHPEDETSIQVVDEAAPTK